MSFKVTTKQGDEGLTTVGSSRVYKDNPVVEAIGSLDELDAFVSMFLAPPEHMDVHTGIRSAIYEIMGDIHLGKHKTFKAEERLEALEKAMEPLYEKLKDFEVTEFVQLQGSFNLLRALTRKAERRLVSIINKDYWKATTFLKPHLQYLNRVSDFWYLLALRDYKNSTTSKAIEL